MKETFVVSADFSKITSRSNHTFDLTFNTSEMPKDSSAYLLGHLNQQGTLAFKIGEMDDAEINALPESNEFPHQKSLSERLRNVLFVYFRQKGGEEENFEDFRKKEMERIITHYKNKLEPE